jgi:DNA-binding MarR family transcriptional regulator
VVGVKASSREAAQLAAKVQVAIGRIARRLRQAHEVGELTMSEVSVLARLDRESPAPPGLLAECERVRPQAMAATLAALERRGMVERAPDPTDRRRVLVVPTEAGRAVVRDRHTAAVQHLTFAMDEEFTPTERRRLADVLPLLDRLAERL